MDAHDIYRFPTVHTAETHFLLENLWISEASLGILDKFQCSLDLPNANYDYGVLFLGQMYWLFIYALIDHRGKLQSEFLDTAEKCRDSLMFLQDVTWFDL